jgi:hypothetical protein
LVQDSMRTFPGRRTTATRASLRAAGPFIDSQSLFGNSDFLRSCNGGGSASQQPLAMVVPRNPRDHFVFLDLLGFYLQIQDNHFIPDCLLVSTCVASCNWIFN